MNKMKLNIPTKIAILTFVIISIAILCTAWLIFQEAAHLLHQQSLRHLEDNLRQASVRLFEDLQRIQQDAMLLVESSGVKGIVRAIQNEGQENMTWKQPLKMKFQTVLRQRLAYEQISLIAKQGHEILRVERQGENIIMVTENHSKRAYFKKSIKLQEGQYYFSDTNLKREQGRIVYPHQPLIRIVEPIFTNSQIFGLLVININFEVLTHFLEEAPKDVHYFLTNKHGDYLFHPDQRKRFAYEFGKRANIQDDYPNIDFNKTQLNSTQSLPFGLVFQQIPYTPFNPERFFILGAVYQTTDSQLVQSASRLFISLLIAIALSVIIALFVHYQMKPIRTLTQVANHIALGETQIEVPTRGNDEISVLAKALQAMLKPLEKSRDELRVLANSLERQVEERTKALSIRNDAIESAINGIMITDISGAITYVNPAFVYMWGYQNSSELMNQNLFTLWKKRADVLDMLSKLLRDGHWLGELTTTKQDGSEIIMQLSASLIGELDQETGIVISFQDSTQRRQAEAALAESERRFRTIFEKAALGIGILNSQGIFISTNTALHKILGYSHHELIEMCLYEVIHPDERKTTKKELSAVFDNTDTYQVEKSYLSKKGTNRWCRLSVSRLSDEHIICMMEDITLQKRADAQLQAAQDVKAAQEAAESANQAKSEFLANMSHELRTPLNGILGFAQILNRDKTLNPQQQDAVHTISQSGKHLLTLINDILDMSKIEAGKMELHLREFKFHEFLKGINDIIHVRAKQMGINFTYKPLFPLPIVVKCDETRLRQVLVNLLGNAVKFTQHGSIIFKVGYTASQEQIRFQIEDTGPGIPPDQLETIFMPFKQISKQQYMTEGTGLGLPISKKFVEMMGGTITVESTLGKGSIFWFDIALPVVAGEQLLENHPEQEIIGFKGKPRKILVVDDKSANCSMLDNLLSFLGFEVHQAKNGQESIEKAQAILPDVILMDLIMPVMDGFEATRQIRQISSLKETVIIAASASAFEQHRQESLEAGCHDFIAKPIQTEELLEKLRIYLKLEWLYEVETSKKTEQPMILPPAEFIQTLYDIAMMGDVEGILEKLKQADKQFVVFTAEIRQLAEALNVQKISKRLEYYLNN